jgi:serine/threonine protein kinase
MPGPPEMLQTYPNLYESYTTFQDSGNLFLLMEYMIGGELFHHLRSKGKFPLVRLRIAKAHF